MRPIPNLPEGPFAYLTTAPEGEHHGKGHVYIVDATGRKIASLWGPAEVKMAVAELIISAQRETPSSRAAFRNKIEAIKAYRAETRADLKTAVDWANANPHLWECSP